MRYGIIYTSASENKNYNDNLSKCITTKFSNSVFQGTKSIFNIEKGNLYIDNCNIIKRIYYTNLNT